MVKKNSIWRAALLTLMVFCCGEPLLCEEKEGEEFSEPQAIESDELVPGVSQFSVRHDLEIVLDAKDRLNARLTIWEEEINKLVGRYKRTRSAADGLGSLALDKSFECGQDKVNHPNVPQFKLPSCKSVNDLNSWRRKANLCLIDAAFAASQALEALARRHDKVAGIWTRATKENSRDTATQLDQISKPLYEISKLDKLVGDNALCAPEKFEQIAFSQGSAKPKP